MTIVSDVSPLEFLKRSQQGLPRYQSLQLKCRVIEALFIYYYSLYSYFELLYFHHFYFKTKLLQLLVLLLIIIVAENVNS